MSILYNCSLIGANYVLNPLRVFFLNSSKRIQKQSYIVFLISFFLYNSLAGQSCTQSNTVSGYDCNLIQSGVVINCAPPGAIITGITLTGSIGGFCPSWYEFDIYLNGVGYISYCDGTYNIPNLNGTVANGTSIYIQSWDNDVYCDLINLSMSATVSYSCPVLGAPATVGWTAASGGSPAIPTCGNWSADWCAGSGTSSNLSLTQGVNYTVENQGSAACGTSLPSAYLQAWWSGGATACGYGAIDSPGVNSISFNAPATGSHIVNVSSNGGCATANTCGGATGHDFSGGSAVLRYRQNTTVTNSTSTADICLSETKSLTATLGGGHNNPTVVWSIISGGGSIAGTTYTPASTGSKTIRATVGNCSADVTFNVVGANITPTFNAVAPICAGAALAALPTTSTNGITGSWSPALDNMNTTTYTFTPTAGQCAVATTLGITVNSNTTPTFSAVAPICAGAALAALPTTSTNGITGSWSPALDNMNTTTYTFTPTAGQCATTTTLGITVNSNTTPTFNAVAPICAGAALAALPTTSTNGITGSWSPALDNMNTTTYTFTPTAGQCAVATTLGITVNSNTTPTFNAVAPICAGAALAALPTTSTNGITGSWSPALDNMNTATYTFTPTAGQCAVATTLGITVNSNTTPTFSAVAPICAGAALAALPTTSTNGITGSWSPALDNMNTTTYTFTPTAGQCAVATTLGITVNSNTTPTFNAVAPICAGAALAALPTTSTNGITGSWSPALDNMNTATYTFTPTAGQCAVATTLGITVNSNTTPTFSAVAPICAGAALAALPTTSTNGITGSWSPALDNMNTTTYTFTPTAGQCATTTTLGITVNSNTTPTFNAVAPICAGAALAALPTTSTNGITGSWSPALDNMNTATYTFTPTAGQCATTTTLGITVNPNVTPTFNAVAAICAGGALAALPTTSTNGITGSWSPALDNMNTATYTFTPTAGQCATTTTLGITVNPNVTPTFNAVAAICAGGALAALPTTSTNGITGSWSPALDNMNTATYTFTPTAGQCATTTTLSITVNPNITPTFNSVGPICAGDVVAPLPTTSTNAITGSWSPAIDNMNTATYTFTPTAGQCATSATQTITVKSLPTAAVTASVTDICPGETATLTASGGTSYAWSPSTGLSATSGAVVNASPVTTQTYTVVATDNGCSDSETVTITVTPIPVVVVSDVPSVCAGESATLTASGAVTYSWAPATGLNTTTGDEVIATPTATQTYTVTGTDGLCQTSQNITITVKTNPTVTVTPAVANLCAGNSITLTGVGAVSYIWLPTLSSGVTVTVSPMTTTTYTALGTAANGCVGAGTATVTVTSPASATVSYAGLPFCTSTTAPQSVTQTGTAGGTYTSTAGLSINATTGAITPSTSSPGTYTITYSIPATGGCALYTTTTSVTINAAPVATISYPGSPFCSTLTLSQNVSQTGAAGGVYSSTAGLNLDPSTGSIIPSTSTPGTYTVTYTIAAASGCPVVTATTSVTITAPPTATISYAGTPFCTSLTAAQSVSHTGTTGGTYFGTAGLTINAGSGAITPSSSSPGNHTVTYTVAAAGGCPLYSTTTAIDINTLPVATITYPGSPFCGNLAIDQNVSQTGTAGGTYTSTAGLTINAATGAINPSSSTAGTYTVTYTIAASSGCPVVMATTSVIVTTPPVATITYASPFCKSVVGPQAVIHTGTLGGTYSSTAGLTLNAATGSITPSSSTAGGYTVTYTIAAAGGCPIYTTTIPVTINPVPTASISYPGSPFCGNLTIGQNVSQTGTAGGTYTSTAGLSIDASTGAITPSTSTPGTYTVTYTIAAAGGCAAVTATTSIVISAAPNATISYLGSPFCKSLVVAQAVSHTGTTGGTYSSTAGLTINATTGAITPSSSTAGTYTVTYTIAAGGGCPIYTTTTTVTITAAPTATITYPGSPFCGNLVVAQNVSQTGTSGGAYTSTAGLTIDATTGAITPSSSTAATYTVTYTIAAAGGCLAVTTTSSVTINAAPSATISYASPFCMSMSSAQSVILTGTSGGTYSSTAGLSINATTGAITPSTSTAGTYTVTYTIAAASGCPVYTTTTSVTINPIPAATIAYTGSPFCGNLASAQNVSQTGTTGGTYTSTAGLSIDAVTGAITPSISTAGTYTVTYTIAAASGCPTVTATTSVVITAPPAATISYASPFCMSMSSAQSVTRTGTSGGTYSSIAGLSINVTTGAITPSTSTAGTYTVTYTIAAASGCPVYTTLTSVTINPIPVATITYTGSPFCGNLASAQNVSQTGTTGGTYTSTAGLSIDAVTGAITPSISTAGTYTVTYTIAAASGCPTVTATTSVVITTPPTATISYASPFCMSMTSAQSVTRTGTSGGTYSSTAGLSINATTGAITPSTSTAGTYTVTYTIAAASGCPVYTTTTSVTINPIPAATITYTGSPFCGNLAISQNVTQTGTTGGTYTSTAGLTIDAVTGAITPSISTAGTYTVTYTIAAASGCPTVTATTTVVITTPPTATISYAGSPFCNSVAAPQSVTQTGNTGGIYSSTPGLTISAINGSITPASSVIGTYTVTYSIAAANGCPVTSATASIAINPIPAATISYTGSPFCGNQGVQSVTLTGTTGGTFTSGVGLSMNATTGAIDPSASTAGTYTVTYTIAAGSGCPAVTATASVTITAPSAATISYAGSPFCSSTTVAQPVTHTGTTGGTYSSTAGLTINAATGAITPSTSLPATYTVTYTMAAANGCPVSTASTSVTVNPIPTASISYSGSPFCGNQGVQSVTLTGTTGGNFTSGVGLSMNATTGAIDPSASTAGTYTVTYTIAAGSGCPVVTATTSVTITATPAATISYAGSPFCNSVGSAQPVSHSGTTGGTYSSTAGLTINAITGAITPAASTSASYTVTYTIAAANGCPITTATTAVAVTTAPSASISYPGSPFCASVTGGQPVTLTGTNGGTFSAPSGLSIDAATGAIDPSLSTAGTYTVTYTVVASGGCSAMNVTTSVTINAIPTASIAYSGTQFCSSIPSAQPVTLTGTTGGTYSSTAGLSIDAATGAITPSLSTPGNYTVTYDITPAGCSMISATTTLEIVLSPTANISYSGPYCASVPTGQPVILNGTGNYTGGSYVASPAGLSIDAITGAITPNLSTAGTYLVTYTVPASSGCSSGTATANVTITATPSAIISYASPFCSNESGTQPVTFSGSTGGTYTSTAGLTINASTGVITPSTSTPGIYVVTYTTLPAGSCPPGSATSTVEILATPVIDDLADQTLCDLTYTLPAITGTSLTGNEMYFTAANGGGAAYSAGDVISSTTTLFIHDTNGGCSDEESFTVTINQTPVLTNPGNQLACGTYLLPAITGSNLSGSEAYYNNSQALGGTLISGSVSTSQTVWIYDANGTCSDEESFVVTINAIPDASFTTSNYCGGTGSAPVITGAIGGTFAFNPAITDGATIDATTGLISGGINGTTYTIEYTISGLCPVSTQEQVSFNAVPASPVVGNDTTYCSSETFVGMTASAGSGGTLNWFDDIALSNQIGTGTSVIPANVNGTSTYYVTETVSGCVSLPSSIDVTVNASPVAPDAGNSITYCKGDSINNLVATGSAGNTFNWYDDAALTNLYGTGSSVSPLDVLGENTYYVTQTSVNGCESVAASVTVSVNDCFVLEVSSAFTPGDGNNVNNFWEIPELNLRYPDCRVTIFNRWGQILFESNGYATPWDGTYNGENLPVGSYYYIIEFNDADNTTNATGTVTIIRN